MVLVDKETAIDSNLGSLEKGVSEVDGVDFRFLPFFSGVLAGAFDVLEDLLLRGTRSVNSFRSESLALSFSSSGG